MKKCSVIAVLSAVLLVGFPGAPAGAQGTSCLSEPYDPAVGSCPIPAAVRSRIDYPLALANEHPLIKQTVDTFLTAQRRVLADVFTSGFSAWTEITLDITYQTYTYSPQVLTLVFRVENYTGGAHGDSNVTTFTFDLRDNAVLTLGDLFQEDADFWGLIAPQIMAELHVQAGDSFNGLWEDLGSGASLDFFQAFALDAENLYLFLPPYRDGPTHAGTYTVVLPLNSLTSVLKPQYQPLPQG